MTKIIFCHLLNDYSGSPRVLSDVISVAKTNGYSVELYVGGGEGFLSEYLSETSYYQYKRYHNKYLTLLSYCISQVDLFFKLLKYKNQDVAIYVNTLLPFGAALAGKLLRKKVIYHIHETSIRPVALKKFLKFIVRFTSAHNIFVSRFLAKSERVYGVQDTCIYNTLPKTIEESAKLFTYSPMREDKFTVLMICSLRSYKGLLEFISVARTLEDNDTFKFNLVLNATSEEIDVFFSGLYVPSNVQFFSSASNVIPYYLKASVLLNLSHIDKWQETFGLTILEAMSFGVPCIVPPVGGPLELVEDDQEGYLISSEFPDQIAAKLKLLFSQPETCIRLSTQAKIKAMTFSRLSFEKEIIGVINAI